MNTIDFNKHDINIFINDTLLTLRSYLSKSGTNSEKFPFKTRYLLNN